MKRIRFMHVPKSAGTSFLDCLSRIYPGEKFVFIGNSLQGDLERYEALPPSKKEKLVLFGGHAPRYTGHQAIDHLPTITLLRNPVHRVISLLQHMSERKSPFENLPPNFDLDRKLGSGDKQLSNYLARTLLSHDNYDLPELATDSIVEEALDRLTNGLECFGFVEHIEESLMLFARTLDWKRVPVLPRLNEANREKLLKVSDKQIEKIRELNRIDLEIYERALRVFRSRLNKTIPIKTNLFRFLRR